MHAIEDSEFPRSEVLTMTSQWRHAQNKLSSFLKDNNNN